MHLNSEEQAMLAGTQGAAKQEALQYQIKVGEFFGAQRMVPISNAHMMGDIEVLGDTGLTFLKCAADKEAHCVVPITTNARCVDFSQAAVLGQDAGEVAKEREVIHTLRRMNVITSDTCINYQTLYQPHLGEHVAWGDTGTVIYANSVFGARTNFESGPAALAAAITGRTPEYGFHLPEHRRGTFTVEVQAQLNDLADWGALGKLVGLPNQSYYAVPVFTTLPRRPTADELKHLGASLASYGSMGMFHIVGITPEAPSEHAALAGNAPTSRMVITQADLDKVFADYSLGDGSSKLVVFSGPQQSLFEIKLLSELFVGRQVAQGTQVFITTSHGVKSAAAELGYLAPLQAAGVQILEGVCFYILQNLSQIKIQNGWTNLISNSAKLVNIIGAHKFNTILRRTQDCVDIACGGVLK